ncbi:hypothetical protein TGDOM2_241150 [Toxoplasma gondii GAB2-2007-GAL-DOM2]|uniref:carnosine N-methyltransferase n=8 Tax=Toxoplasma gondii TaxID=5811 RepID=S7W0D7_TOXGG|nr:hypothetical protein TGGT1_241150 [Toxoplasma gondii GT1]KAF4643346.1 hypothetical protein TGRH88_030120 [Toxoplasma gondii]KFG39256.1 hypothetical protein TGDOM2_241150 [Toxoplasma gondii GAB2-2007-GAL-DOM2]KFG48958.1 hypothetical protein TGFOU_241150 [Toxoplasma gondii FOU]KFH04423.1 hypothetical protein TGVAND_241150 [Toxoplasma gondii VAND]KFH14913.1 hypothetical protein TGMAS_241150 [Toxoplasma gondii MAS]PUA83639.1 hypothetical protein TGBR9_241150 [Toxoplasma gondii TgCATBr9]RQX667
MVLNEGSRSEVSSPSGVSPSADVVSALAASGKNDDELGYMGEGVSLGRQEEDEAELEHFASVRQAFELYEQDALMEVHRIERHLRRLAPEDKALLQESIDSRIARLKDAVSCNQAFINLLLIASDNSNMQPPGACPPGCLHEDGEETAKSGAPCSGHEGRGGCTCHPAASVALEGATGRTCEGEARDGTCMHASGDADCDAKEASTEARDVASEEKKGTAREKKNGPTKEREETGRGGSGKKKKRKGKSSATQRRGQTSEFKPEVQSPSPGFPSVQKPDCCGSHRGSAQAPSERSSVNPTDCFSFEVDHEKLVRNMSKVRSTLRQFVRDWSDEGREEREAAYGPLLEALETRLPIRDQSNPPRVLCPGSGLGRLPFEVTRRGYACQGNEFSYFMLMGSDFILNHALKVRSVPLQPYCLSTSNRRGRHDHLQTVWIPDVSPNEHISPDTDFSMCAGEFVEVYGGSEGTPSDIPGASRHFDAVLTSYFLDTAKNVLLYIRTVAKILRPGGLWANVGPLLYHYAEMPYEMSIELAWDELEDVIKRWFDIERIEWRDAYYTSNPKSMMQVQYHCVYFVAIRNSAPAPVLTPLPETC